MFRVIFYVCIVLVEATVSEISVSDLILSHFTIGLFVLKDIFEYLTIIIAKLFMAAHFCSNFSEI